MSEEIYTVGQTASFTKTVTETDVVLFAGISGDLNPAHVDEVAAKQSMFKGRVAHGILGASFISAVIGMKLPGPGTLYLSQDLQFVKPIYFNDTVTATVTIKEVGRRGRLTLETKLTNQDGKELITGEAKVFAPK
ncbi:MaoC family dehydratase [Fundicoccus ignavus]|uniref:Enoyl-CoA hydratase n=1 Tax=Fundicoccus ignavus TaxID=2664442 RepID=A0A6I2GF44_9LACT|nr:MaoC family dehydratase [Fundicoccus ignavus]MRI80975.1 enoyl-CoA hydratase [Fundicoccus ignavus]MRI86470.1 enoyl-CoA hydratase [Fundicoccus ignavus]MRJ47749.1 enoyl-CoA hydratase [Fundicoccus ignavus]